MREPGNPLMLMTLDDSPSSPFGPPSGRSTRYALLSRLRGNDVLVQAFLIFEKIYPAPVLLDRVCSWMSTEAGSGEA
jgi:hypothetical protein